jgi:tetratricopeptide (TPR) repeat protein
MNRTRLFIALLPLVLAACQTVSDRNTIAELRGTRMEIEEENLENGLDKAMESYERFLQDTPDSALTPEAIRRLADLKIEKEYGAITATDAAGGDASTSGLTAPTPMAEVAVDPVTGSDEIPDTRTANEESEADFEKRATESQPAIAPAEASEDLPVVADDLSVAAEDLPEGTDDLEKAGPMEAIALYQKLLDEYPLYERNDQVLYQMSRAYEELGRIDEAMEVMDRMCREYPESRYIDEVQFRRAEYFFSHKAYLDAEDAYTKIVKMGVASSYYELALYKLGWAFYKQELYEEGLHDFIALLDYKVSIGYDFEQTEDETELKRTEDTFRVISLSFSNLGGADSVVEYFERYGQRSYEDSIYSQLAEFYFDKRRYADASETYNAFVERNPFHKASPGFHMRIIEIHGAGGFPSLVLESKKAFATTYGLSADYWQYFEPGSRPEVMGWLKTNLTDLANHYHACYQDPNQAEGQAANFGEALNWYRQFLNSFPADDDSSTVNYRLADLLMEHQSFGQAAVEYEKTAYDYPVDENSSKAGYAAVYAFRQELAVADDDKKDGVKREAVRSSLKFVDTFPEHEKAAIVLRAAADDLYIMADYAQALAAATKLLDLFPDADTEIVRSAWLVRGHSSYELGQYGQAEGAYVEVLALLPPEDETREGLIDNLAASIYKQGEQANADQDYRAAADHFLRVGKRAPTSKIRPNAEYDGAMALIQIQEWGQAAEVLTGFRDTFPEHELQPEVTKKLAYVYKEDGRLSMAAGEYERIERESQDDDVRGEALQIAAELYEQDGDSSRALDVYQRYVAYFPQPVELNVETRNKIAGILKAQNEQDAYLEALRQIVAVESDAGEEGTPRTHYLAAKAALVLAQTAYERFVAVKLEEPIEENLLKKQELMKAATKEFGDLTAYEFDETTAAATFYIAEIYAHFSNALMTSERPEGLSALELEQYELAIEEQAYPFEEQAITVHESNFELISLGIYNEWVKKSMERLAESVPARYDKQEDAGTVMASLEAYEFAIAGPAPEVTPESTVSAENTDGEAAMPAGQPEADMAVVAEEPGGVDAVEESEVVAVPGESPSVMPEAVVASAAIENADAEQEMPSGQPEAEMVVVVEEPGVIDAVEETEVEDVPEDTQSAMPEEVVESTVAEDTEVEAEMRDEQPEAEAVVVVEEPSVIEVAEEPEVEDVPGDSPSVMSEEVVESTVVEDADVEAEMPDEQSEAEAVVVVEESSVIEAAEEPVVEDIPVDTSSATLEEVVESTVAEDTEVEAEMPDEQPEADAVVVVEEPSVIEVAEETEFEDVPGDSPSVMPEAVVESPAIENADVEDDGAAVGPPEAAVL